MHAAQTDAGPMQVTAVRVTFADTDAMGVVYHANYLKWFEVGRTELIRDLGIPYTEFARRGLHVPVAEANVRYVASAKYDDLLHVQTTITDLSPARIRFAYRIVRAADAKLLCEGFTMHGFINPDGRPVAVSKAAPELYAVLVEKLPR